MQAPLKDMQVRNIYVDSRYAGRPGIKPGQVITLSLAGTFGKGVRHSSKKNPSGIHQGWDIYAPPGTDALAITNGTVVASQSFHGYGRSVMLKFVHQGSALIAKGTILYAFYAHLSEIKVWKGKDTVNEGTVIGKTGTDGNAADGPPHLHFGISRRPLPSQGLDDWINPGEVLGYWYLNLDNLLPRRDMA